MEFPSLNLTNVQEFLLVHSGSPVVFHPPSFPALQTFTVQKDANPSHLLSALLSNPSVSPSLKTLEFRECVLTEEFMDKLIRFASDRKSTTLAQLHRVAIAYRGGELPSTDCIRELGKHVLVVEAVVRMDP